MRRWHLATAAVMVCVCLGGTACDSTSPATVFHPGVTSRPSDAAGPATPTPAPAAATDSLVWPPFGKNVHIVMSGWLPANPGEAAAVTVDKDFQLAYAYSQYTGGNDQRWQAYIFAEARPSLLAFLKKPPIESFAGTVYFTHYSTFPDPISRGALDVAFCWDGAHSVNVSLATGKVVPSTAPADQQYVRVTDVLARTADGQWRYHGSYQALYYPQGPARECKP